MWIDSVDASEALSLGLATAVDLPREAAERRFAASDAGPSSGDFLASFWWVVMLFIGFTIVAALIGRASSSSGRPSTGRASGWRDSTKSDEQETTAPADGVAAPSEEPLTREVQAETARTAQIPDFPKVRVEYVIDGDTVVVAKGWGRIKIRLDSIDCPENGQPWGDTAKYGLVKLIGGRKVKLEEHGQDHHGRTLATLYVQRGAGPDWINVNERMVTLGHAWVMRRFYTHLPKSRQDQLNRLERWARSKRVGLWRTANPTPPWKWRSEVRLGLAESR
jgi:endonuclease YncB( thermonuclease family)